MFGSRKQPELLDGRYIVLRMPLLMNASDASKKISDAVAAYPGEKSELLLGYWDYGEEIVITAPLR